MSALGRVPASQDWLTIREASALVGVSVATMRRWCDAGEVRAFTTPGGHRRFARSAVLGLAKVANGRNAGVGCNGETRIRMVRAYRREMRLWLDSPAAAAMPDDVRRLLRDQGVRIVGELIGLLDASPRDAWRHTAAAREGATLCGHAAAQCGLTLDATIAIFVRLRAPFIHQLGVVLRGQARDASDTTAVLESASDAFDQLLPAMVTGFERGRSAPSG